MAIFGNIEVLKKQIESKKFSVAFDYLSKVLDETTEENHRLNAYDLNVFKRVDLNENNFALEQTYLSKERENCFFESHRKYIDVQFILEGEEMIEVSNTNTLHINVEYNENIDLIKYGDSRFSSLIKLKKGDIAIFFPDDAHMPCVKISDSKKIVKTVVKVPLD